MSLKVWLPLTGNVKNLGLLDAKATVSGATANANGKLGLCYSFSGSNYISINKRAIALRAPEWSISCWLYLNDISTSTATCLFSERTGANSNGYTIFIYPNTSKILVDDGTRWETTTFTFAATTWYHFTVTRNPNGKFLYINGELIDSTSTVGSASAVNSNGCLIGLAQSGTSLTAGNQGIKGRLNDFRVYDHCLSAKEVEELSRGLVLHYKLNNNNYNNVIYDCSGNLYNGSITGTATIKSDSARYDGAITMNNTSTSNKIMCNLVITLPTTGITVSFWVYTTKTNTQVLYIDLNMSFAINSAGTAFYVNRTSDKGFPISYFPFGLWNHVVLIRTGSIYSAYINGVNVPLSFSTKNNWSHNVSNIYILNRSYNTSYGGNGSVCDFRVYATALTEDQILDLYKTSATIDNKGNVYSREYIENDNLSITKTGLFLCDNIYDNNNLAIASVLKNERQVLGYSLYEY